ncbi:hypothetical protein HB837_14570 [Listeria innocua]|uniref:MobP2 family relaxase n=1 Tax=Listeria innocua TaxID=1642 RepID=UPI001626380B|nr:MobP2 family relaxase [Listeria innocua]MBC1339420.1 hypothetical protein [Listeria innocua]MBC1353660.1 hypothetical protein [Listeria innocua]
MSKSPGIFYHSKFVVGGNAGALRYADDKDKLPDHLASSLFLNYMDNPQKASGLINMEGRYVTLEERKQYTSWFDEAEAKGSLLWQDLFSFDHSWLSEHGMYDERTGTFDLMRISKAIIASEKYVIEQEGYQKPVGCFAFHTNTDNLHAHFSLMELEPSREMGYFDVVDKETGEIKREKQPIGKRDKKTIKGARRIFANKLLHHDEELTKITSLIRDTIVGTVKEKEVLLDPTLEDAFLALYQKLPNQRNRWTYGYAKGQKFLDPLNHLIQLHLDTFYSKEYTELVTVISKLDADYQATYHGESKRPTIGYKGGDGSIEVEMDRIDDGKKGFKENKLTDLYTRLGNAILREVKGMDKEMRSKGLNPKDFFSKKSLGKQVEVGMAGLRSRSYYEKEEQRVKESLRQLRDWKEATPLIMQEGPAITEDAFEGLLQTMPPPEEPGYPNYMDPEAHFEEVHVVANWQQATVSKAANEMASKEEQAPKNYYAQKLSVERKQYQHLRQREIKQTYLSPKAYKKAVETEKMVRVMRKAFRKEYQMWINEQAFEQLRKEVEWKK